jgi:predicted DNA-binding transcriptional regulator AlpA
LPAAQDAKGKAMSTKKQLRRLLDKSTVTATVGKSFPWIWARMREGKFPRAVVIGGSTRWYEDEIVEYIDALPRRQLKGDGGEAA